VTPSWKGHKCTFFVFDLVKAALRLWCLWYHSYCEGSFFRSVHLGDQQQDNQPGKDSVIIHWEVKSVVSLVLSLSVDGGRDR
jgi:hypothetical protein